MFAKRAITAVFVVALPVVPACVQRTARPEARSSKQSQGDYAARIDELLPGMGSADLAAREAPQQQFERLCFGVGAPGAEPQRAALCRAICARLGPGTAQPARVWLLRQLERIGAKESVASLAKLLGDTDAQVAECARRALQNNPAPSATAALRAALSYAQMDEQRIGLIDALAARGACDQVDLAYFAAAACRTGTLAAAGLAALGDCATDAAIEKLYGCWRDSGNPQRAAAGAALLRAAERLVADGQAERAERIYLDMYNAPGPQALHSAALVGLVDIGDFLALPYLIEVIRGQRYPELQLNAVRLLGEIPGALATRALVGELDAAPAPVQVVMLDVLAGRDDAAAKPAVSVALASTVPEVRIAALHALQRLGDASDVVLLAEAAARSDGAGRDAARASLAGLRGFDVDPGILVAVGRESDERVRAELIRSLAPRHFKLAVSQLLDIASDPSETVRVAAFETLGQLAGAERVPRLLGLLVHESGAEARTAAEESVATICLRDGDQDRRAAPVLAALETAEGSAKAALLRVLGHVQGPAALRAVRAALQERDEEVYDAAVRALSEWQDPAALDDLHRTAREAADETHHVLALRGYVRLVRQPGERSANETAHLLSEAVALTRRAEERKLVLGALGEVKELSALVAIRRAWSPDVVDEAGAAIVSVARGIAGRHPDEARVALGGVITGECSPATVAQAEAALKLIEEHAHDIGVWLYTGPYSATGQKFDDVFAGRFGPETAEPEDEHWQVLTASNPDNPWIFELDRVARQGNCCLYAKTGIWSEIEQPARLVFGSDDGIKAWLNDELVHSNPAQRGMSPEEDSVEVALRSGWNVLVVKVVNAGGAWGFCCGVRPAEGKRLARVQFRADEGFPWLQEHDLR